MTKLEDVVKWRLCLGCGACAYISDGAIGMVDDARQGYRPVLNGQRDETMLEECLKVCPATGADSPGSGREGVMLEGIAAGLGPVLEVWEGHALDPETRHLGSSGGALTALARYAIERGGMHGVLHVAADPDNPVRNRTVMSHTREELLANTGSRYSPASVCDGLKQIEVATAPCVFIGQPSEVAALRKAQGIRPALDRNIGVALSFFCAGSPSSQGTLDLLKSKGVEASRVARVRYRGRGWPGMFAVWLKGESEPVLEMTYAESWGFVQTYRPWGVQLWPDGLGEQADIACGDPWHRENESDNPGSSLVVVRTEAGRRLVRDAMAAGYLELTRTTVEKVVASQRNLLLKRGAVWGRLMSMRVLGLPTPTHAGSGLFGSWLQLSLREKVRSTLGTVRRILAHRYHKPNSSALPLVRGDQHG
ncbi:MAG: Coenzyme F420 hydrogenase/dehydrogenase, beta subunit C-terminal domain [Verrucomicrobiota bacterium]